MTDLDQPMSMSVIRTSAEAETLIDDTLRRVSADERVRLVEAWQAGYLTGILRALEQRIAHYG